MVDVVQHFMNSPRRPRLTANSFLGELRHCLFKQFNAAFRVKPGTDRYKCTGIPPGLGDWAC